MKRYFLYGILLAGTLAGCSKDVDVEQYNPFSAGEYPLQLSAEVDGMHNGSDGQDYWNGDGTEYVGIRMGNNSKVAKYLVGNDKSSLNPASGEETLY